jgi:hypothetical protein
MSDLVKLRSELTTVAQPSSVDLVLAKNLDYASQVYKTELMPGEVRVWQNCFAKERPEALAWGFREYFRTGKFPPKPADIADLIRYKRESPYFDSWDADIKPAVTAESVAEYRRRAAESNQEFFNSPEYQQFLERMKREHGI